MRSHVPPDFVVESVSHTPSDTARQLYYVLNSAGHFRCDDSYFTQRSGLKNYLMLYTLAGRGELFYRGREYEAESQSVFFIDCEEEQLYRTVRGQKWEFLFAHVSGLNTGSYFELCMKINGPVVRGFGPETAGLFSGIIEEKKKEDVLFEPRASLMIARLLTQLATAPFSSFENRPGAEWVTAVTDYIKRNYRSEITVEELSRIACLSKFHFIRSFKVFTGYTPYKYLLQRRLSHAKELLATTSASVAEIAADSGFSTSSAFVSVFKRMEEATPREYRRLHPNR